MDFGERFADALEEAGAEVVTDPKIIAEFENAPVTNNPREIEEFFDEMEFGERFAAAAKEAGAEVVNDPEQLAEFENAQEADDVDEIMEVVDPQGLDAGKALFGEGEEPSRTEVN